MRTAVITQSWKQLYKRRLHLHQWEHLLEGTTELMTGFGNQVERDAVRWAYKSRLPYRLFVAGMALPGYVEAKATPLCVGAKVELGTGSIVFSKRLRGVSQDAERVVAFWNGQENWMLETIRNLIRIHKKVVVVKVYPTKTWLKEHTPKYVPLLGVQVVEIFKA